jgi:hypothetical protein
MKTKLLAVLLLAGASAFAGPRVFVGVGFGGYHHGYAYRAYPYRAYVPAPIVAYEAPIPVAPAYYGPAYYEPPMPGPGYVWIAGWGGHRGYWSRPRFDVGHRFAPRYFGGHFDHDRGHR